MEWPPIRALEYILLFAVTEPAGFASKDALGLLLSTESLMFAALNVAIGFSAGSDAGKKLNISPRLLAHLIAGLIVFVGIAAASAWYDVFYETSRSRRLSEWIPIYGIALGIVVQPILAVVIARNVAKP